MKRFLLAFLLALAILAAPAAAHPGGTDASGGHHDRSGGSYHYHHGYSAHQHTGGVCPYDFDDRTGESSGMSSGSSLPSATRPISSAPADDGGSSRVVFWSFAALALVSLILLSKTARYVALCLGACSLIWGILVLFLRYSSYVSAACGILFFGVPIIYWVISAVIDRFRHRRLPPPSVPDPELESAPMLPAPALSAPHPEPADDIDSAFWSLPRSDRARAVCSGKRLSDIVPPPCRDYYLGRDLKPHSGGRGSWGAAFTAYVAVNHGKCYHFLRSCGSSDKEEACVVDAMQRGLRPCPKCAALTRVDLKWYRQQLFTLRYCRENAIPVFFDDGTPSDQ